MDAESVRSEMKGVNHKNWQYWRTLSEPLNKSVGIGSAWIGTDGQRVQLYIYARSAIQSDWRFGKLYLVVSWR